MPPLRFSVTMLETYRLYRDTQIIEDAEMLAVIKRESVPDARMRLGTAVHSIIERPPAARGIVEIDGFWFDMESFGPVIRDCRLENWEREAKVTHTTDDGHTITGRIDTIGGLMLMDYKVTERPIRLDKYHDSYQWRLYLIMTGCWRFDYVPIQVYRDNEGVYRVADYCMLSLYSYPGMENDCDRLIQEFVTWVRRRGLDGYLVQSNQDPDRGAQASNRAETAGTNVAE